MFYLTQPPPHEKEKAEMRSHAIRQVVDCSEVSHGGVSPYRIGTAKDLLAAKNGDKNVWRQRALEWI